MDGGKDGRGVGRAVPGSTEVSLVLGVFRESLGAQHMLWGRVFGASHASLGGPCRCGMLEWRAEGIAFSLWGTPALLAAVQCVGCSHAPPSWSTRGARQCSRCSLSGIQFQESLARFPSGHQGQDGAGSHGLRWSIPVGAARCVESSCLMSHGLLKVQCNWWWVAWNREELGVVLQGWHA